MEALAVPIKREKEKPEKEPRFHVILLNDDYNTVDHVVRVLLRVLGGSIEQAVQMTAEAHHTGRAIIFTGSLTQAELIRDKILGYAPCQDSPAECEPTRLIATLQKVSD